MELHGAIAAADERKRLETVWSKKTPQRKDTRSQFVRKR